MPASIFNGNAVKILKNVLRFKDGTELASTIANYVSTLTSDAQTQLDAKIDATEKGAADGVATLDSGGKVPVSQLPNSIMEYLGTWAASTNTPTLANGVGNAGDVYIASDAGTVDFGAGNITFAAGDWVVYSGTAWEKSINSNSVVSVNGFTGIVTLDTDVVDEGATNLYFTIARAQAAITGAASSIVTADLTASRALASDGSGKVSASSVTATELGELSGVTSNVQTQLNGKEPTITVLPVAKGGTNSSTALNNNRIMRTDSGAIIEAPAITANRALASDASGIPTHTAVTDTELGHLSGVTSAVQTQLDSKAATTYVDAQDTEYGNRVLRNYLASLYSGASIAGINTYNDGASPVPVDGTGGTATGLSTTLNTSTPLRRASCQRFSKDAADRQGMGWSIDFDVDPADYEGSKSIFDKFVFKTSANYVAGDVRVFAYDKDNGQLLNVLSLNGDGSLVASPDASSFTANFNTVSTSNSYRLIFHITSTNALAYDIDLIDLSVGPDVVVPGAIAKKTQSYSPTITGFGTVTLDGMTYAQVGDQLIISGRFNAGTVAASSASISLPSGYVTASMPSQKVIGKWWRNNTSASTDKEGTIIATSGGLTVLMGNGSYTSATTPLAGANGNTLALTGESISVWFSVPVTALASAALSTTEAMLTTVRALGEIASFSVPHNSTTTVTGWTEIYDPQNGFDTSTGIWTAPKPGYYLVSAGVRFPGAAGGGRSIQVTKNGTSTLILDAQIDGQAAADQTLNPNKVVLLAQNDTLRMRLYQNQTSVAALATSTNAPATYFSIQELPDFSIFSTYGTFELLTATSATKTPTATDRFHQLTGNSLTLTPGTWRLFSSALFGNGGTTPAYTVVSTGWYAANGADTNVAPAQLSTASGLTVLTSNPTTTNPYHEDTSGGSNQTIIGASHIVRVTAPVTVYLVSYSTQTTSANARVTVYANAERLQ